MENQPTASVIIATYNRKELLVRALSALFKQTAPGAEFEIVVVDDGSDDGTESACLLALAEAGFAPRHGGNGTTGRELHGSSHRGLSPHGLNPHGLSAAEFSRPGGPAVRYLARAQRRGPAAARNAGVMAARGETSIFVDSDLIASPELVAAHLACQARSGAAPGDAGTSGRRSGRRVICDGPVIQVADLERLEGGRAKLTDISRAFFATGNVSLPKAALVEAGLFDEEFREYGWEDLELGLRLRRLGLVARRCPDAVGYHYKSRFAVADLAALKQRERERGHTAVVFWRKRPVTRVRWATSITPVFFALDRVLAAGGWPSRPKAVRWLARLEKRASGVPGSRFWHLAVRFVARIITLHAYAEGLREGLATERGLEQGRPEEGRERSTERPVNEKGDDKMADLAGLLVKLKAEHPVTVKMLEHLGQTLEAMQGGKPLAEVRPELENFERFLGDVLYGHFRPEEQILFPPLLKSSGKETWDLVRVLLDEHHAVEQQHRDLKAALAAREPDQARLAKIGAGLVMTLTSHIYKEDNKLFPLVEEKMASQPADQPERPD